MAIIRANDKVVTQINVFEVDPMNQDALANLLMEAVQSVCNVPGWISASIHKSLDGTRVVNYAQASDYKCWEAVFAKVQKEGFAERFQKLAKPNPCLCHCVFSLSSD
jgi:Antibiotic biosynthesis monooxygenase